MPGGQTRHNLLCKVMNRKRGFSGVVQNDSGLVWFVWNVSHGVRLYSQRYNNVTVQGPVLLHILVQMNKD